MVVKLARAAHKRVAHFLFGVCGIVQRRVVTVVFVQYLVGHLEIKRRLDCSRAIIGLFQRQLGETLMGRRRDIAPAVIGGVDCD